MRIARAVTAPAKKSTRRLCGQIALYTACTAWTAWFPVVHADIDVDGRLDEAEWQQATSCGTWSRTEPFTRDEPRLGNDLRFVATPRGLAAAFIIDQPSSERRVKPRTPRDAESFAGDSITLLIDFDATGQTAYEFSVGLGGGVRDGLVTNQNNFNRDWDGHWWHAVRETDDQWFVEILVPWDVVNMRRTDGASRSIGVYGSRYLFERNERYACPGISEDLTPAFVNDFERISVPQFDVAAALDFIPYVTAIRDNLTDEVDFKAGADISWRPSQNFWLTATLNPDFGQVESDELVVDFSAIETVFTDKRPFFTENQAVFDLRTPANGQLIYTRRVGGPTDDGLAGSSDIDAALKVKGNMQSLEYGAFVAQEDDYDQDVGRLFAATRVAWSESGSRIGYLGTWTDRPFLERQALVNAIDYDVTANDWWRIAGQFIRSDVSQPGGSDAGYETWMQVDLNRTSSVTHTARFLYIDEDFDLNDLGYMERNSLRQFEWDTNRSVAGVPGGRINGETQRLYLIYRENDSGQRLQSRIQASRDVNYVSKWRAYEELRITPGGVDDLISRGNGPVQIDTRYSAYADVTSPRLGDWQFVVGAYVFQQGVEDYSAQMQIATIWYPTDKLTLRLDAIPEYSDDWLLWEEGNLFGTYRSRRLDFDFRLDWIPAPRHELRIKWQWIGIDADPRQAWRTDADGDLYPTTAARFAATTPITSPADSAVVPFTVSNLGLQIRYRYELAPQSDLYLVYARGGYDLVNNDDREIRDLFRHMDDVRDADQFLIKFSYRL